MANNTLTVNGNRVVVPAQLTVAGAPLELNLVQNPTIDDVLIGEARVWATSIETNNPSLVAGRVVPLGIRDYLIRLGIER